MANEKATARVQAHIMKKHTAIVDERHFQLLTKAYIASRRRMIASILLPGAYLIAFLMEYISNEMYPYREIPQLLGDTVSVVIFAMLILGLIFLVKAIRAPFTQQLRKELEFYEAYSNNSDLSIDINNLTSDALIQCIKDAYDRAPFLKKAAIIAKRMPTGIWITIVFFFIGGIAATAYGISVTDWTSFAFGAGLIANAIIILICSAWKARSHAYYFSILAPFAILFTSAAILSIVGGYAVHVSGKAPFIMYLPISGVSAMLSVLSWRKA